MKSKRQEELVKYVIEMAQTRIKKVDSFVMSNFHYSNLSLIGLIIYWVKHTGIHAFAVYVTVAVFVIISLNINRTYNNKFNRRMNKCKPNIQYLYINQNILKKIFNN